jgi:hypothetical protein
MRRMPLPLPPRSPGSALPHPPPRLPGDAPANPLHRQPIACRPPRCAIRICPACRDWLAANFTALHRFQPKPRMTPKGLAPALPLEAAAYHPAWAFHAAVKRAARSRSVSNWHSKASRLRKTFSSVSALPAATISLATTLSRKPGPNRSAWPIRSTDNGAHPWEPSASPLISDRPPAARRRWPQC